MSLFHARPAFSGRQGRTIFSVTPSDFNTSTLASPPPTPAPATTNQKSAIILDTVYYRFEQQPVLNNLSLTCPSDQVTVLLGTSGSGKSTLLRLVAGLAAPESGKIFINGHDYTQVPAQKRPVSMVFQNFSLFPHLSVAENVAYGLPRYDQSAVDTALVNLDILHLANRYPTDLSGGQKQRVALARALATRPEVLLLDEPLAHVDATLRGQIREDIRALQHRFNITVLYVTHDLTEALTIADYIAVMQDGKICQFGTGAEIYYHPINAFVAEFFGPTNFLKATVVNIGKENGVYQHYQGLFCGMTVDFYAQQTLHINQEVLLNARPHQITLTASAEKTVFGSVGQIIDQRFQGEKMEYLVETQQGTLICTVPLPGTVVDIAELTRSFYPIGSLVVFSFSPLWAVN